MKKTIITLSSAVFLMGTVFTGCTSPAQKVENEKENVTDANKALEKANEDYLTDMANFRKETAEKMTANDKSIAEFKARIAVQKQEARADYTAKITALEQKNSDFRKKLDDYKETGKDKWDTFKAEFNRDMDELGKALKDLTIKNNK